jgi:hypothetical protein
LFKLIKFDQVSFGQMKPRKLKFFINILNTHI